MVLPFVTEYQIEWVGITMKMYKKVIFFIIWNVPYLQENVNFNTIQVLNVFVGGKGHQAFHEEATPEALKRITQINFRQKSQTNALPIGYHPSLRLSIVQHRCQTYRMKNVDISKISVFLCCDTSITTPSLSKTSNIGSLSSIFRNVELSHNCRCTSSLPSVGRVSPVSLLNNCINIFYYNLGLRLWNFEYVERGVSLRNLQMFLTERQLRAFPGIF